MKRATGKKRADFNYKQLLRLRLELLSTVVS